MCRILSGEITIALGKKCHLTVCNNLWTLSVKISSVEKSDGCHAQAGFCLVLAKSVRRVASSHDVDHLVRAIKMLYLLILIDVPMYIVFSPHVRECVLTRWETSTDKVPKVSLPFLSSSAGKVPWCSIWL